MPATITRLVSATPAKQGRKNGYALVWNESPSSPTWLAKADFETLRENVAGLDANLDAIFVDALEAGANLPEEDTETTE